MCNVRYKKEHPEKRGEEYYGDDDKLVCRSLLIFSYVFLFLCEWVRGGYIRGPA